MKKMDNKGFSLVELIIVIAIMAILVGVLAPTYMRYVEKTRISRDASACDSVASAIENTLIDWSATHPGTAKISVQLSSTGMTDNASTTGLYNELKSIVADYKVSSSKITSAITITGEITGGEIKWNGTALPALDQFNELKAKLKGATGGTI